MSTTKINYKNYKSIVFLFLFFCLNSSLQGQTNLNSETCEIKGIIMDQNQNFVTYATVALQNQDSVIIEGEKSMNDGTFLFQGIAPGTYRVVVQHLEYQNFSTELFSLKVKELKILPVITLVNSIVSLDEIVVTGRKAMIEIQADKIVFNVASSPSASGTNGLDLLRKSPGVTVDMDNNISLQGKGGVQIYINGIQSRLSGNDLATMLESMTSDNIEAIEIITNPSSKYDAEGNAGIINIRLKRNVSSGFNGNITTSASKGNYYRNSQSLILNYGGEKVKSSFEMNRSAEDIQDDFYDVKAQNAFIMDLDSREIRSRKGYNFAVGVDAQLHQKHTLSFTGRAIFNDNINRLKSTTNIYLTSPQRLNQVLKSQTNGNLPSQNLNFNLNHKWEISETSVFNADVSFGKFQTERFTMQPNTFFEADSETVVSVSDTEFNADTYIDLWSAKMDYEKTWNAISFSTGVKFSYIETDNSFAFYNLVSQNPVLDLTKSNDFTYSENVTAAYAILNATLSKYMKLNAGMRVENTSSRGRLISELPINDKDVPRNYTDFFPNVSVSFNDQKNHSWSIGIGRRITRPNYQDLNPFESPLSQLITWKGNPFLRPNYIMNYQFSYAYKQKLTITNTYSVTKDFFATIFEISGEQSNILIPRNMQKATNYGVSLSYPLEVCKYWDFILFLNGYNATFRGDLEGTNIDLSVNNYNFRIQNNVKLPWGMNIDLTYHNGSDWIWRGSIRVKGNQGLSFGIRKDFFDKRLQVRITGADIFRTDSDYFYNGDYGGILVDGVRTFDNQRFGLGATLKFGNQKAKVRKKSGSALDEELGRLQGSN